MLQEDLRLRQEVLKMRDQKHASELAKVEEAHCSRYMDLEKAHEVVKAEVKSLREASDKVAKEQMERAMRIYGAELALEAALTENAELKEQMDAQHAAFLVQLSQPSEVADTTELDAIKEENRNLRMDYQNALARHQDQAERLMDLCRKYQKFAVLKGVKTKDARSRQSSKLRKAVASAKTRRPAEPVHLMADASTNTDSTTELQRCTLVGPVTVAEIVPSPELSTTLSLTVVPEVDSLMADEVPVYTGPIADASMDDVVPVYTGPIADTPVADEVPVYTGPIADASMADEVAVNTVPIADVLVADEVPVYTGPIVHASVADEVSEPITNASQVDEVAVNTVPIADVLVADEVPVYTGPIVHASVADEVSEPITNASQADEVPVNTGPIAPTTAPPYMPVPFFQQPPPTQPTAAISLAPPYMPYQMAVAQRLGVGLYSSPTQMPLFTEPQVVPYLHPENAAAAERRVAELFEYPSPTSATFSGPYFFQQAPLAVPKVYSRKRKQPESDVTEGVREKELDDELERAHEKQRKLDEEREIREQAEAMLKMAGLVESSVESDEDAEDDATAGRGLQGAEAAAAAAAPSPPPPPPPPPPAPSTSTIDMSTLDPALSS